MIKNGNTYQLIRDHLGSVRLVVDVNTGAVAQKIDYDEFGNVTFDSNPDFAPFAYGGGLYDSQTKLTRFGARDYEAASGRWTCKDPIGFYGGVNLFSYVASNPINRTDPSGRLAVGAIVGGVLGAISGASGALAQNGDWFDVASSAVLGGLGGAFVGAIDPTEVGGILLLNGVIGGVADIAGQALTAINKGCDPTNINWGSVVGSTVGSALSGAMGSTATSMMSKLTTNPWIINTAGAIGMAPGALGGPIGNALSK